MALTVSVTGVAGDRHNIINILTTKPGDGFRRCLVEPKGVGLNNIISAGEADTAHPLGPYVVHVNGFKLVGSAT